MTIDGFEHDQTEAFKGYSPKEAERVYAIVDSIGKRLGAEVEGLEHVPEGRALIVANHSFGFDVAFAAAAIYRATGRRVWGLGEHAWWKFPFIRRFAAAIGVVDGTQENTDRLLAAEELVLVLPGGLREAMKPRELRYRLLWGHRYGFVRAAIRNHTPLVPLAAVGSDEVFDLVGNAFERSEKSWFGKKIGFPLPRLSALPHKRKLRYIFGEPIMPPDDPELEHDPKELRKLRHEVEGALHELIDIELARRAGFPIEGSEPQETKKEARRDEG